MTLGYKLKKEREKRNWYSLSNYERDPDTTNLGKLADLYEVSTAELLGRLQNLSSLSKKKTRYRA